MQPNDAPSPSPSAHLAEALRWLVAHSQSNPECLTPSPLELAEVLWLASRLPRPASPPRQRRPEPPESPPSPPKPRPVRPEPRIRIVRQATPSLPGLPPDPFLPTPFPQAPSEARPEDTLLPVAVLPDNNDVAMALADTVLPGRVREEDPLGDRAKLLRALAPLLRRRADSRQWRLDEERTVDLYAQTRLLQPVMQPARGPAFDEVLLLMDGGLSMQVWRRPAEQLRAVLASSQVFPRVRLADLDPGPVHGWEDRAFRQAEVERLSEVAQLIPGGSPLLLLVSDTAGRHWWDGRMFAVLERWARSCPTAILQPLPLWHWNRTALAAVERVSVRNTTPAAANPRYRADPLYWWDQPLPPGTALPVPVLPLDRDSLGVLSAVVMGDPAYASSGVALPPEKRREEQLRHVLGDRDLSAASPTPAPLTAEEAEARWMAFQAVASPQAQQLLLVMATAPLLTLPVIVLLQAAQLPEASGSLPIAEVLISGLVTRKQGGEEVLAAGAQALAPERIQFELQPAVANLLRDRLPPAERLEVIRRVSALVERRWNREIGEPSFEAVLCDPSVTPPEGKEGVVQFATVTARLLDTLPGEKARAFAERIRRGSALPPRSPWPPSMVFEPVVYGTAGRVEAPELETISLTMARCVEVELRRIAFQTATVERYQAVNRGVVAQQASEAAAEAAAEGSELQVTDDWPRLAITSGARSGEESPPSSQELPVEEHLSLSPQEPPSESRLSLSFLSERGRAESLLKPGQSGMVEQLLEASVQNPTVQPELANVLAQLLLPKGFQDWLQGVNRLVLVLDATTATFPWELVRVGGQQLALAMAVVRQLPVSRLPQPLRKPTERRACVVGNPQTGGFYGVFSGDGAQGSSGLANLEGATREAETVLSRLQRHGYVCEICIEGTAIDVINRLYHQPCRVLHLAGHGVFRRLTRQGDRRTGVVLSDGLLITSAEIEAMEVVPELVFLNCCHLGPVSQEQVAFNQLAASMAGQLLALGVRAVVACGWAVDDRSAVVFAEAFYDAMLAGKGFGEAIFLARKQAHGVVPNSQTWGAYQAYGDPAYQLEPGEPREHRPAGASPGGAVVTRRHSSTWAFREPLRRDALPLGATAERADPLALTLVEIPAGEFWMGSPEGEEGSYG
ncbi:MAG: SAV_2336 N-terminal domain-related protein, partial [Cyanobacteriota bacterium]